VAAFPAFVYLLCVATSTVCAFLLIRSYRCSRAKLLLWSALCFIGLALSNLLLFLDAVIFPQVDLLMLRQTSTLAGVAALLYGFIFESE
jgi:hypothetical protein